MKFEDKFPSLKDLECNSYARSEPKIIVFNKEDIENHCLDKVKVLGIINHNIIVIDSFLKSAKEGDEIRVKGFNMIKELFIEVKKELGLK